MAVHFVGFRGEEYLSAVRVWGLPDMVHRVHDARAQAEFADGDTVVFARGTEGRWTPYTFDDSREM